MSSGFIMHCLMVASLPWGIFFCFLKRAGMLICRLKVLWGLALGFPVVRSQQRAETPPCNCLVLPPKQGQPKCTHTGQGGRCTGVEHPKVWICTPWLKVTCHLGQACLQMEVICVPDWKMTRVLLRSVLCFVKWICYGRMFQNLGEKMFWGVKASSWYITYCNSILYL